MVPRAATSPDHIGVVLHDTEEVGLTPGFLVQWSWDGGRSWPHQLRWVPGDVALDLSEPEGVGRAVRWMAERLGVKVGTTAPRWESCGEHRWYLGVGTGTKGIYTTPEEVPALALISLASPTADGEALIAVVRHLAGVRE